METVYKHQKPLNYYRWGGAKLIQITGSTYHTERANRLLARFDRCAQTWAITISARRRTMAWIIWSLLISHNNARRQLR
jgi:hypothetical protein